MRVLTLVERRGGRGGGRSSADRRRSRASAVVIRGRQVRKAAPLNGSAPSRVVALRRGVFVTLLLLRLCWKPRAGVVVCRHECLRNPTRQQLW